MNTTPITDLFDKAQAQAIFDAHTGRFGRRSETPAEAYADQLPDEVAFTRPELVYRAAKVACLALGFIEPDAECLAHAFQARSDRLGFEATAWPDAPADFGLRPRPRTGSFAACPHALGLYAVLPDFGAIQRAGLRLGLSTHGYAEMVRADALDPSYIALGAVFPTTLKRMATAPQGTARLAAYAALLREVPLVAIGGIDFASLPEVLQSGVGSVAVVRALVAAADPEAEAARFLAILDQHRSR